MTSRIETKEPAATAGAATPRGDGLNTTGDKEHIADLLRRHESPSVVMAEVRLREVVNGSPGSIVQVRRDDLREILLAYRRLIAKESA